MFRCQYLPPQIILLARFQFRVAKWKLDHPLKLLVQFQTYLHSMQPLNAHQERFWAHRNRLLLKYLASVFEPYMRYRGLAHLLSELSHHQLLLLP